MAPPPGKKSSKGLWIAIGGAVAVAGIIVVIVVATRGGSDSSSSAGSADKSSEKGSDTADTSATATDGYAGMLAKMSGFKDQACACKDKACVDAVGQAMVRWSTDQAKNPPKMGAVDDTMTKKMTTVMDAYTKCVTDVLVASAGGTTPHAGSAAATPASAAFAVGDRVQAKWTNGLWYPGKVSAIRADGTYDIHYDDGDRSNALPASHVRKRPATTSTSTSSTSRPAGDAPCPGPGITRRCNGVCVNIQENNNHCGGCNHQCPSGKTCDGHLFCRDAQGNL